MADTEKAGKSIGRWLWPLGGALLCLGLGTASGLSSVGGGGEWYQELIKPPGTPPPWVFGPVWSVLYLMMGVALGRLIHRRAKQAAWVFGMQFVMNLVWTPVFFGMHEIAAALAVICAIWFGVFSTILLARKVDRISAGLLVPYLAWVSYATYLNAGFFWLNGR
ncbi:MAG: TspO/MBR family protein [Verrucomicrobiota bacterium]